MPAVNHSISWQRTFKNPGREVSTLSCFAAMAKIFVQFPLEQREQPIHPFVAESRRGTDHDHAVPALADVRRYERVQRFVGRRATISDLTAGDGPSSTPRAGPRSVATPIVRPTSPKKVSSPPHTRQWPVEQLCIGFIP